MAFDIKKEHAMALGCAMLIGFLGFGIGRLNSSSDTNGYQPITSLTHLDQAEVQAEPVESSAESFSIEDAKQLPVQLLEEVTPLAETDNQLLIEEPQILESVEDESEAFGLELGNEPLSEVSAPNHLAPPAIDTATEQASQESTLAEPVSEPFTVPGQDNPIPQSLKTEWKNNPFLSTNAPAFEPVNREQDSGVQTASMVVPKQAVRSLNDTEGMSSVVSTAVPEIHPSGSMVGGGAKITPVQLELSEAAAQKAVHHIEYGKSLVRRGAIFAARNEFFSALRVLAESNDARINGNEFSMALSKAIRAMKEAEDFNVDDAQSFAVVDVPATIDAHKTKLFTDREARQITPLNAMQRYYTYAGQQLDFAGGRNVVSAEAFQCLGKLHSVISSQRPSESNNSDVAQAIVFHQSSLLSNSNNPSSANELGVLLAKSGNLDEATKLFKKSLISESTPQAWSNLAKTHHRMGEQGMAQMAQAEIAIASQSTSIATAGIQWIDAPQFNAMAPLEFEPRVAQKSTQVVVQQSEIDESKEDEKPKASIAQRIKKWF